MSTVLIVEDEYSVRENLKDLLEAENFNVLLAQDGVEGFKKAVEEIPDLILSDILMPKMDGFQLLLLLQSEKATSRIPFLFITAKIEMTDLRKGMNLGADDYLIKPFRANELLDAINLRLLKKANYVETSEELKEKLVVRLPHELRTPLVGIIGFSEMMEDEIEGLSLQELKDMAGVINKSGKRLHRRIEKFLQYSELISLSKDGVMAAHYIERQCEVDSDFIKACVGRMFTEANRGKDSDISFESSFLIISGDYYKSIICELVENSLKFSKAGTTVCLKGFVNGHYYKTSVHDKGSGIDKISLKNIGIFNQFSKEIYDQEGLGIGLALVKAILKLFNGYMTIDSKENEFTAVEFGIPLANKR